MITETQKDTHVSDFSAIKSIFGDRFISPYQVEEIINMEYDPLQLEKLIAIAKSFSEETLYSLYNEGYVMAPLPPVTRSTAQIIEGFEKKAMQSSCLHMKSLNQQVAHWWESPHGKKILESIPTFPFLGWMCVKQEKNDTPLFVLEIKNSEGGASVKQPAQRSGIAEIMWAILLFSHTEYSWFSDETFLLSASFFQIENIEDFYIQLYVHRKGSLLSLEQIRRGWVSGQKEIHFYCSQFLFTCTNN